MQCPRCNHENREHAQFCVNCGARLVFACPECATQLPLSARFCDTCGAAVGTRPPVAPAAAPEAIAQRLQRLVPREYAERLLATRGQVGKERRAVTILFSDVKGSTAIAEALDPEDWAEIMDGAFDVLIEPIYRYEGTLARLMGDAILAFFGAPIAHEDDPERACRAALEITTQAAEYAEKLEGERGIKGFNVRVGINTGLVVVGEIGSDLRVEYTAMGDAVNLAARMESAAEPGTVLISEDTHKLIAPLFDTEALVPIEVKGRTEPVPVYRVLAAKAVHGKPRGIAGLESPLVGREAELAALQEALERLQAGVGGIVTLVGDAGIGKSRLVAELRNLLHVIANPYSSEAIPPQGSIDCFPVRESSPPCGANGGEKMPRNDTAVRWVEGRCLSYGTSMAYLLWLDVLRGLLGVTVEDSPVTVRDRLWERAQELCPQDSDQVYPYLARLMSLPIDDGIEATMRDLEGEKLKANTFSALEMFIQCAANQRPLVLVCEDLHWADGASIDLLEQLLSLTDRSSLLLICVFRPVKEHGSWRIKETAARSYGHRHTDIPLKPLSASHSALLVANLLQIEDLAPALKQRILDVAEGNPFYVEEIIRSLVAQNAIVRVDASGRWVATEAAADIPIPDTLHGVLLARIDRLQEEAKRVLQMAAVIGRIFLYRVLAAIAEEEQRLDEHLLTLQREEMIRERARIPELEYIFKHELTREAAYNGVLKVERRALHRQVAQVLERLFPERIEEQLGLLAHHWERAGDAEKATEYLLRAGDQARNAYAHQEAIDYYERALVFLKQQGEHERAARTLMKLGLTFHTALDFKRARQAYEEGFALWRRAGETEPAVPPAPAPHALRIPSYSQPLDPIKGEFGSWLLMLQVFGGLVNWGAEQEVVPDVARSWEVLEGGRKYVFHLRDDVRWSDGTPVTARDFEYAWRRVLDPANESPVADLLYDVRGAEAFNRGEGEWAEVGVRAQDEVTLIVDLEGPAAYFLHLLLLPATYPVPRHVIEAHGEAWTQVGHIVSNGPFQLQDWQQGQSMVLVRNPLYHGRFTGNVRRLELSFLYWSPTQLEMYRADKLDVLFVWGIPHPDRRHVKQRHAEDYLPVPFPSTFGVAFDVTRPPFDDRRVRRAFVLATDREALADVVGHGFSAPATGGLLPNAMPGHSPGMALPYDPQQARQLLADAGYPDGHGFPTVDATADRDNAHYAENLQAQWRDSLGIDISWRPLHGWQAQSRDSLGIDISGRPVAGWSAFVRKGRTPHLWYYGLVPAYPDPDVFLRLRCPAHIGWRNETYDSLVNQARHEMDPAERMKLYRQADRILIQEAVILPTSYGVASMLVKPWVKKLPATPSGWYLWKNVIIEPH